MQIRKKVRECDKFGAQVHLMHKGESHSGSLCGGVVSLCLVILTFTYFCIGMAGVAQYADPNISSYIIFEDRNKMDEPINLADNN